MRLFVLLFLLTCPWPAVALVTGFEDAVNLSVECEKGAKAELESLPGLKEKICLARGVACDVKEAGTLLFRANIDVACAPKAGECPLIEVCANQKLSGKMADVVRLRLDPNNSASPDGASLGGDKKSGKEIR